MKGQVKTQQIDNEKKSDVESNDKHENEKLIKELKIIIKNKDTVLVDAEKELEKSRREIVEYKRRALIKEIGYDEVANRPFGGGDFGGIWL